MEVILGRSQWRRQDFVTGGKVRYGSVGCLEYEVPQSRLYCLCINVALCSTALQCIFRVIRRSSMAMKAHTYYIIFGRPPVGGKLPSLPLGGATGRSNTRGGSVAEWLACWTQRHFLGLQYAPMVCRLGLNLQRSHRPRSCI